MNYKAIGFDYGGVIRGQPGIYFTQAVCNELGISIEKYKEVYYKNNHKRNLGHGSWEEFWEEFVEEVGGNKEQASRIIEISHNKHKGIHQNVLDLITDLRKDYKVGLYSNNTHEAAEEMRASGIDLYFDVFWISAEVGYMKPDPEGFKRFFEVLEVNPEESVFIDDAERSLSTAEEVGFTPVLYRTYDNLIADLKGFGIV